MLSRTLCPCPICPPARLLLLRPADPLSQLELCLGPIANPTPRIDVPFSLVAMSLLMPQARRTLSWGRDAWWGPACCAITCVRSARRALTGVSWRAECCRAVPGVCLLRGSLLAG